MHYFLFFCFADDKFCYYSYHAGASPWNPSKFPAARVQWADVVASQVHIFERITKSHRKICYSIRSYKILKVEGNVRAVFSSHRRQLSVWNENRMLICIDLHYAKVGLQLRSLHSISHCRLLSLQKIVMRLWRRAMWACVALSFAHFPTESHSEQLLLIL